jgi:hypothetical protein
MIRFFDAESNADEQAVAYARNDAEAVEFGMRLALANPSRGVEAKRLDFGGCQGETLFFAYPTTEN